MIDYGQHIDDLIAKVLSGEATEHERAELNQWIADSDEHKKFVEGMVSMVERVAVLPAPEFDVEMAWQKVRPRIQSDRTRVIQHPSSARRWMYVAASAAAVLVAGYFLVTRWNGPESERVIASSDHVLNDSLPDGTAVVINKGSRIEYAYFKGKKLRQVHLTGEALFSIKHDTINTFIVETENLRIEDIGTVFNVNAHENADTVEVFVREGIVRMTSASGQTIDLVAGETGWYIRQRDRFEKAPESNENAPAYADRQFRFRNDRLGKVVAKLNEVYATRIVLGNPALADCRITVTFNGQDIETIAGVLAETLSLTTEIRQDSIVLSGNSCGE